jgi:hypothetical protein
VINEKNNFCERILLMQTMQRMVTSKISVTTTRLPPVGISTTLKKPIQNQGHKMKERLITHHISLKKESLKNESKDLVNNVEQKYDICKINEIAKECGGAYAFSITQYQCE